VVQNQVAEPYNTGQGLFFTETQDQRTLTVRDEGFAILRPLAGTDVNSFHEYLRRWNNNNNTMKTKADGPRTEIFHLRSVLFTLCIFLGKNYHIEHLLAITA
jgi:hypothetical protein